MDRPHNMQDAYQRRNMRGCRRLSHSPHAGLGSGVVEEGVGRLGGGVALLHMGAVGGDAGLDGGSRSDGMELAPACGNDGGAGFRDMLPWPQPGGDRSRAGPCHDKAMSRVQGSREPACPQLASGH